jgi:hypothetical protein
MFNERRFWKRAQRGEFQQVLYWEGKTSPPHQPPGTRSQVIRYIDKHGVEVARVHQYLRRDGTLGASGRPDPKRLFIKGILYLPRRKP